MEFQEFKYKGGGKNTEPQHEPKVSPYHNKMIRGADIYDNSYLRNHPAPHELEEEPEQEKKKKPARI